MLNGNGIYLVILIFMSLGKIYGKIPPIWEKMADSHNEVLDSNYGWQMAA